MSHTGMAAPSAFGKMLIGMLASEASQRRGLALSAENQLVSALNMCVAHVTGFIQWQPSPPGEPCCARPHLPGGLFIPAARLGVHCLHWPGLPSVPVSTSKGRACLINTLPPLSWNCIAIKEK